MCGAEKKKDKKQTKNFKKVIDNRELLCYNNQGFAADVLLKKYFEKN